MNLGKLITILKDRGDKFISWYGIETNIESVGEITQKDGVYFVELKIKEEKK